LVIVADVEVYADWRCPGGESRGNFL